MRNALVLSSLCALTLAPFASAQSAHAPPRTPDGKPDLQGTWTNSSITTLERSDPSLPLMLNAKQVERMENLRSSEDAADAAPTDRSTGAPTDRNVMAGYNAFWMDRGGKVGVVKGQARSSWIVEPADGKMPFSSDGRTRISTILAKRGEEGPEGMNPADRCLIGSRGSGGPPMLNNFYNNTYQIVQTPTHVIISVEMMHDARIIRIDQAHKPEALTQWLGDSVGHWGGDTLIVTTKGWNRWHGNYEPVFLSEDARVTERFTRSGAGEVTYEFAIDDPGFYSQP